MKAWTLHDLLRCYLVLDTRTSAGDALKVLEAVSGASVDQNCSSSSTNTLQLIHAISLPHQTTDGSITAD